MKSGYGDTLSTNVFKIYPLQASSNVGGNIVPVVSSPLFQAYQNLYEEMKVIGMKVQICVTDQIGGATLPSLQIYTAWDRRHGYGEPDYTSAQIKNSASNNVATALNNNVAKLSRSIYASDLIEKAQWMDSSNDAAGAGSNIQAYYSADRNPNFFCPAFFMCFGSPSLSQASEVASVHFSVSVTYYIAFRNPRYGGSASNRELPTKTVTFADDGDGGDDMDDGIQADIARLDEYMYHPDEEPAGAARAAADPAPLERRPRSDFSQRAGDQPQRKKNAPG